jgi:hypothetical protein
MSLPTNANVEPQENTHVSSDIDIR